MRSRFPELPNNPYCLRAACGFGRDGIPAPYAGGGLRSAAARAYRDSADQLYPHSRTALLSWLSSADLVGAPVNANDLWGYVSPRGREYAIVGLVTGTVYVDITAAGNPRVVGFVPGPASDWRDIAVYDEYAYVVNERGGGLQVVDLRRIDRGDVKMVTEVVDDGLWTAHNVYANPDSGYVYVLGANIARGGLLAFDLSDPRAPTMEPVAWDAAYVHDVTVVSYTHGRNKGREIAFAFTGALGLHVIDITDKGAPKTLANLRYTNATYGHSGSLSPDGRYLYVNDELDERLNSKVSGGTTYVVRVGRLDRPKLVRQIDWGVPVIDHNSAVQNGRLYVSAYRGGLRVFDLSDPKAPRAAGYFDTYPETDSPAFTGAWGVFAGFPSGNVIVSDIERGLFVIRAR